MGPLSRAAAHPPPQAGEGMGGEGEFTTMAARALPYLPWRKPEIESGPVRLTARRLYILPTRAGLVFGLLLLGLLIGAINYGVSLAYLFTFWFAGLGVVGMLHTQRNLSGLEIHALPTAPVFTGEIAEFALRVDNPGRLPRRQVRMRHADGSGRAVDIPAGGHARVSLSLPQPRRGWRTPGRFAVHSEYPLGLFRCWSVMELDWGVLVYPAPAPDALPLPVTETDDDEGAAQRGEGTDFAGLRGYQPGDPPRRIAWKAAARGSRDLLTKQFAGSAARGLWLDWRLAPEREPEARLSRLARWALDAHAAGLAYGLRLPGREIPQRAGEAQLRLCLEALARQGQEQAA
jgi:uncharacterized protein (DUF58 family)